MMKRALTALSLALLATTGLACSGTQSGASDPAERVGEDPSAETVEGLSDRPGPAGMFEEADADHDGKVTLDEARAAAKARFAAADTNHDGALDAEELRASHKGPHGPEGALKQLDKDGDGAISKDEAPPRMREHFDEIDANHDGRLDKDELLAARKQHDRGPGDRGPRDRGPRMLDADGDGKVTLAEMTTVIERWFVRADANADGAVTIEEVRAVRPRGKSR